MKPRVGLLLGDPTGVGPEMAAKLLADPEIRKRADILIIGDPRVLATADRIAGVSTPISVVRDPADAVFASDTVDLLPIQIAGDPETIPSGRMSADAGAWVYETLKTALTLAQSGAIHGFCFAPLNKAALKAGGAPFGDEHQIFAQEIGFDGPFCEHNVLDGLWTTRVSSHIPVADIPKYITRDRVTMMTTLARDTLASAGIERPRIAVCALNPHAGDNGLYGREEIDIIAPAIEDARADGIDASGPYPADTVFVKAREGAFDAVVTMYHDQGQIAMKLMGFNRGVTVTGGLPIPVATPSSGTAFDIVGKGIARTEGLKQAFLLVSRMCEIRFAAAS